jgi:hypothetical protein
VLILAGQTCLAPKTCQSVKAFAAAGGGVVILGDVAQWDDNGMLYEPSALADLKGPRVIRMAVDTPQNDRRAGHTVCISLPKQWKSVADAIQRAADGRLTARLQGSTYVAMSAFRTKEDGLAIHLVNYAAPKAAGPLRLELGEAAKNRRSARLFTPEGSERPMTVVRQGDRAVVEIPSLDVYGILVVE